MCAMGILVICNDFSNAEAIIKAIIIISCSETFGKGTPTLNKGEKLITTLVSEDAPNSVQIRDLVQKATHMPYSEEVDEEEEIYADPKSTNTTNFWRQWALKIKNDTQDIIKKEVGEYDNARYGPQIANHLLKKVESIVL